MCVKTSIFSIVGLSCRFIFCTKKKMLSVAAILALAIAVCSGFNIEVSDSLRTYIADQGEKAVGKQLHFPCDGVTAKELQNLDLNRVSFFRALHSFNFCAIKLKSTKQTNSQTEKEKKFKIFVGFFECTVPRAVVYDQRGVLVELQNQHGRYSAKH